jgi:hypothetical protein
MQIFTAVLQAEGANVTRIYYITSDRTIDRFTDGRPGDNLSESLSHGI